MTYIYSTPFRGSGGECAGSVAKIQQQQTQHTCPPDQPECDTVNFRGKEYSYYGEETKKTSPTLKLALLLMGAAGIVGGLGFAHKKGVLNKLKDGAFKEKFAEPVTNKCHEWCAWAKKTGITGWEKVKGMFGKKGE